MNQPIRFGKYYLLERINVGGMAEVFRAKTFGVEGFERLLAVKRILPNIAEDKDFIEMFVDEAKIAGQLSHANIARVFDLGKEDGSYYIVLEHVHGKDLRAIFDRMRNKGEPLPVSQACFVLMKVCEGLDYAHNIRDQNGREVGLVHRDVSPQNVLVSFDGEIKLIDFGIAKAAGRGNTQTGILKGKFGYMSPEQVRGLPVDRRSDVFSCGVVLYELLTGERLFVGESDFSTLEKVRNVEVLPPSTYNPRIQPELERIVLKALAKDVEDRYQNAIDLHDELQAFVYTAGEFYSRKDLASWMKQMFAKEIQEESAKIASYQNMAPPVPTQPPALLSPHEAPTVSLSRKAKTTPPPIPNASRRPFSNPATTSNPATMELSKTEPMHLAAHGAPSVESGVLTTTANLEWDEDELETSIYDDEPASRPAATVGGELASAGNLHHDPDLSSLVAPQAQGWDAPHLAETIAPERVADGSNRTRSPFAMANEPPTEARRIPRERSTSFYAFIGTATLLVLGIVGVVVVGSKGKNTPSAQPVAAPVAAPVADNTGFDLIVDPAGVQVTVDGIHRGKAPFQIRPLAAGEHTIEVEGPPGFYGKRKTVTLTQGVAERVVIKLDAIDIMGRFEAEPNGTEVLLVSDGVSKSLGPAPQEHPLDPRKKEQVVFRKTGYRSVTKPIHITGAPELTIATTLVREPARGAPSVSSRPERTKKRPSLASTSHAEATPSESSAPTQPSPAPQSSNKDIDVETPKPEPKDDESSERPSTVKQPQTGTLLLGAKPACEILIDGKNINKKTPQRDLVLPVGQHRITLLNAEFGIKESFTVKIRPGEATKAIKNYMDRIN